MAQMIVVAVDMVFLAVVAAMGMMAEEALAEMAVWVVMAAQGVAVVRMAVSMVLVVVARREADRRMPSALADNRSARRSSRHLELASDGCCQAAARHGRRMDEVIAQTMKDCRRSLALDERRLPKKLLTEALKVFELLFIELGTEERGKCWMLCHVGRDDLTRRQRRMLSEGVEAVWHVRHRIRYLIQATTGSVARNLALMRPWVLSSARTAHKWRGRRRRR
jgi:hypothetical protein